jgi:hypothetical protein
LTDPFTTLGVREDAGDEEIRQRYLALVRAFPPDLEPQRFQAHRAAYEQLRDERKRLETTLLMVNDVALSRLKASLLQGARPGSGRPSPASVKALLVEGVEKALA